MTYDELVDGRRERYEREDEAEQARLRREAATTCERIRQHEARLLEEQRTAERMERTSARTFTWLASRAGLRRFESRAAVIAFALAEGETHVGRKLWEAEKARLGVAAVQLWDMLDASGETGEPSGRAA